MITPSDVLFAADFRNGIMPTVGGQPNDDIRDGEKWVRIRSQGGGPLYQKRVKDQVPFGWVEKDGVLLSRRALDLDEARTPHTDDSAELDVAASAWANSELTDLGARASVFGADFEAREYVHSSATSARAIHQTIGSLSSQHHGSHAIFENTGPGDSVRVILYDTTAAGWAALIQYNFATDSFSTSSGQGSDPYFYANRLTEQGPNGEPVVELWCAAIPNTPSNTFRIYAYPGAQAGNDTDGSTVHYAASYPSVYPSSPIPYVGSPLTRPNDQLYFSPIFPPQGFAFYTSCLIRTWAQAGTNREWWDVGDRINGPGVNLREDSNTESGFEIVSEDNASHVPTSGITLSGVEPGDFVELAGAYENSTGKIRLIGRRNGGAWQDGGAQTPGSWTVPSAWAENLMTYNETANIQSGINRGGNRFLTDLKVVAAALDNNPFTGAAADVGEELADVPIGPNRAGHVT